MWDRLSTAPQVLVFGESHTLSGLTASELRNEYAVSSTVAVFSLTRSRKYTLDLDYRIVVIGSRTRIERLPGGDITEGEEVLVDYAFATTGTFRYSVLDRAFEARADISSLLGLRVHFHNAPRRLLEGTPTQPLNSRRSRLYGARARLPLGRVRVEAQGEYEDQDEEIAPFRRSSYSLFFQIPIGSASNIALSGRRVLQENLKSTEDVDLTGFTFRLDSRTLARTRLTADASYEQDFGGSLMRQTWLGTLLAEWRFRNLSVRAEGRFRRERLRGLERDRTIFRVEVRRRF